MPPAEQSRLLRHVDDIIISWFVCLPARRCRENLYPACLWRGYRGVHGRDVHQGGRAPLPDDGRPTAGPRLAPRHGPGYDDYLPHDAVHFIVEAEAHLSGGVFGRIAAGQSNIFWAADPRVLRRQVRREAKRRPSATERAQMARSEELASICRPLWELRAGHRRELPLWFSSLTPDSLEPSPLRERILARLDEFAARWHALPVGRSITLSWPLDRQGRVVRGHTGHVS